MSSKKLDVVVYGATGFVGQIVVRYLYETYAVNRSLRWGIAGRSNDKLQRLAMSLGQDGCQLPTFTADADDESALRKICDNCSVVLSTVGPYAVFGSTLVKTCAESGTDYADLTAEIVWMREMRERYDELASRTGARLVHCCGFDCIPSDMGVWFLQERAKARFGEYCTSVKLRAEEASGQFSGGSVATMTHEFEQSAANPELDALKRDVYSLCPSALTNAVHQHRIKSAEFDHHFDSWVAPYMMADIIEPVVFQSHALSGYAYGENFVYNEGLLTGPGLKGRLVASLVGAGSKGFKYLLARPKIRKEVLKVLPQSGEGPSEEVQRKGFFNLLLMGQTQNGEIIKVRVSGDRDPGYGATAKMLGEAGVALAHDIRKEEKPGGFWSTASIFDDRFIDRLSSRAGMSFEVLPASVELAR